MKRVFILAGIIALSGQGTPLKASVVIQGPVQSTTESTPFALLPHAYYFPSLAEYSAGSFFWFVGAHEATGAEAAPYTVSGLRTTSTQLSPLITAVMRLKSALSTQTIDPNPLLGKPIAFLGALGINPVIVLQEDRASIYVVNTVTVNSPEGSSTTHYTQIANGLATPTIMALCTLINPHAELVGVLSPGMTISYAAAPNGGSFGDLGSFLGFSIFRMVRTNPDSAESAVNLTLGNLNGNAIDATSFQLPGSATPTLGPTPPTLTGDSSLEKVYLGVEATGGSPSTDGVYSVLVTDVTPRASSSTMGASIPLIDPLLVQGNLIVAARGSDTHLIAYQLRLLHSSTGLPYCIINGGDGTDGTLAASSVYALPILNNSGRLASTTLPPQTRYTTINGTEFAIGRIFDAPPLTPDDLYTPLSPPARIGGGPLPAPLTDIVTAGDAIFAATAITANGQGPGLWHSQALFGPHGTIIAWTPWRRAGGAQAACPIYGLSYDQYKGSFFILTGPSQMNVTTVRTNAWNNSSSLTTLATTALPAIPHDATDGGIQGIIDYPRSSIYPALTIFTAYQSVLIAQTDQVVQPATPDEHIMPQVTYSFGFTTTNGTLEGFVPGQPYQSIMNSGGVLSELGALVSGAIVTDGTYGWFVVAGTSGSAVLANPDGTGWPISGGGLGEHFAQLAPTMRWKRIDFTESEGPLTAIRKLVFDSGALYLLTDTGFYRISVSAERFATDEPQEVVTLAHRDTLPTGRNRQYADCFVAGPLALLATSSGLFRSGNGVTITTASDATAAAWTSVSLPWSPGPVAMLYPIGPVLHTDDAGYDANCWVLSAAVALHQARLFRLTIQHTGTITDSSVQLFPDEIVAHQPAYLLAWGSYRNSIATDGGILATSRSRYLSSPGFARIQPPSWASWPANNFTSTRQTGEAGFPLVATIPEPSRIAVHGLAQCTASGVWLVPGNFGVISNE